MSAIHELLLASPVDLIAVEIVSARGSTPRETEAWMLVSAERTAGTIGGGQLEYMAIDRARIMLRKGEGEEFADIPLGPEIGQCCGGFVRLKLTRIGRDEAGLFRARLAEEVGRRPQVAIFGAGHVGRALAEALALLPVRASIVDSRPAALENLPSNVESRCLPLPEASLTQLQPGSAVVVTTHDHALDFLIASEALGRKSLSYVGMIGSPTKRAAFSRWFLSNGGTREAASRLVCPIGGDVVADKRPAVIAALVAAELMMRLLPARSRRGAVAPSAHADSTG